MLTRGDVYAVPARRSAQGHEQRGPRLGVVVQSDDLPLSIDLGLQGFVGQREGIAGSFQAKLAF